MAEQHYQLRAAMTALDYTDGVHWTARSPKDQGIVGGWASSSAVLGKAVNAQAGWNFYISLNQPAPTFKGPKPAKKDIQSFGCVGIDIDAAADAPLQKLSQQIRATIQDMNIPPDACRLVYSGRGIWLWILVAHTILFSNEATEEYDGLIKGFVRHYAHSYSSDLALYGGVIDTTCGDLSRIARCPGTIHQGTGKMAALESVFLDDDVPDMEMRLAHGDFVKYAKDWVPTVSAEVAALANNATRTQVITALNVTSRRFVLFGTEKSLESRHRRLWSTAKNMSELGVSKEVARPLLQMGAELCRPPLAPVTVDRVMTQVWGKA